VVALDKCRGLVSVLVSALIIASILLCTEKKLLAAAGRNVEDSNMIDVANGTKCDVEAFKSLFDSYDSDVAGYEEIIDAFFNNPSESFDVTNNDIADNADKKNNNRSADERKHDCRYLFSRTINQHTKDVIYYLHDQKKGIAKLISIVTSRTHTVTPKLSMEVSSAVTSSSPTVTPKPFSKVSSVFPVKSSDVNVAPGIYRVDVHYIEYDTTTGQVGREEIINATTGRNSDAEALMKLLDHYDSDEFKEWFVSLWTSSREASIRDIEGGDPLFLEKLAELLRRNIRLLENQRE
jgi:hypothetical protein